MRQSAHKPLDMQPLAAVRQGCRRSAAWGLAAARPVALAELLPSCAARARSRVARTCRPRSCRRRTRGQDHRLRLLATHSRKA